MPPVHDKPKKDPTTEEPPPTPEPTPGNDGEDARISKTLDRIHVTSLLVAPSQPELVLERRAAKN